MDSKTVKFSELIKNYRQRNKITQAELGKRINRTQNSVSNYERDIHYPESAEEIKAIAALLDESVTTVINSIEYSRKGVIEQHEALLIDLNKLTSTNDPELQNKYKFLYDGKEITGEELEKMLKLLKFERFEQQNNN